MEDELKDFLLFCSEISFGEIDLREAEREFCRELNRQVLSLCKSLPESVQNDAAVFLLRYARVSFEEELSFFKNYYVPSWSIIYWLANFEDDERTLSRECVSDAITAHSMAMLLHSLDDHLNDGEMEATHLNLLLRSQAWLMMSVSFNRLADEVSAGKEIVRQHLDDYYSGVCCSQGAESLDGYCTLFRKQMATGMIVPALLTRKLTAEKEFTTAVLKAYGSFGIAWRLLDDINDIEKDMKKGTRSSVYLCLPENIRNYWGGNNAKGADPGAGSHKVVLDYVLENGVIKTLSERICKELESAASLAEAHHLTGWADEFRCLMRPLKNIPNPHEKRHPE